MHFPLPLLRYAQARCSGSNLISRFTKRSGDLVMVLTVGLNGRVDRATLDAFMKKGSIADFRL